MACNKCNGPWQTGGGGKGKDGGKSTWQKQDTAGPTAGGKGKGGSTQRKGTHDAWAGKGAGKGTHEAWVFASVSFGKAKADGNNLAIEILKAFHPGIEESQQQATQPKVYKNTGAALAARNAKDRKCKEAATSIAKHDAARKEMVDQLQALCSERDQLDDEVRKRFGPEFGITAYAPAEWQMPPQDKLAEDVRAKVAADYASFQEAKEKWEKRVKEVKAASETQEGAEREAKRQRTAEQGKEPDDHQPREADGGTGEDTTRERDAEAAEQAPAGGASSSGQQAAPADGSKTEEDNAADEILKKAAEAARKTK